MACQHLDGNRCARCQDPGACRRCKGSGTVNYYDSPIPCEDCAGTGKEKR